MKTGLHVFSMSEGRDIRECQWHYYNYPSPVSLTVGYARQERRDRRKLS